MCLILVGTISVPKKGLTLFFCSHEVRLWDLQRRKNRDLRDLLGLGRELGMNLVQIYVHFIVNLGLMLREEADLPMYILQTFDGRLAEGSVIFIQFFDLCTDLLKGDGAVVVVLVLHLFEVVNFQGTFNYNWLQNQSDLKRIFSRRTGQNDSERLN